MRSHNDQEAEEKEERAGIPLRACLQDLQTVYQAPPLKVLQSPNRVILGCKPPPCGPLVHLWPKPQRLPSRHSSSGLVVCLDHFHAFLKAYSFHLFAFIPGKLIPTYMTQPSCDLCIHQPLYSQWACLLPSHFSHCVLHSLLSSSLKIAAPANHLQFRLPTPTFSALAPSCPGSKNSILLSTLFVWPYCLSLLLSRDSHSSLAYPSSIILHHNYSFKHVLIFPDFLMFPLHHPHLS